MKQLKSYLYERKGEKAHREAEAMGLQYKGFGYWVDPNSGQVTHKTEGDTLVPVSPDVETDKWKGDGEEAGAPGGGKGQQREKGDKQTPPAGIGIGQAMPGQEQKPRDLGKWEPGPDGNTCVGDQPTPEKPQSDAYVRKTNYYNWTAGADGSNFSNVSFSQMFQGMLGKETTVNEQLNEDITSGLEDFAKTGEEPNRAQRIQSGPINKFRQQSAKDASKGKELTQRLQQYVSDPKFKLDVNEDDEIASGAFGSVFNGPKNSVIKQGRIGPDELKAMYAMRNNKNFPTLLNAQFDGPFNYDSSVENNIMGGNTRAPGQSKYFEPDDAEDFEERYPTAPGTFAMTKAKGRPLDDGIYDMDFETRQKALRNLIAARGHLHQSGFSHNDMHPGNVFVDDDGEVNLLDFGLASSDPLSALREAFAWGGKNVELGEGDFQFDAALEMFDDDEYDDDGNTIFHGVMNQMGKNREAVRDMIMDDMGLDDMEDEDEAMQKDEFIERLMKGGLRERKEDLQGLIDEYPNLGNGKFVKKLTERLYRGLGSDQENRMSNAFDKRQQDARLMQAAQELRKRRGEPPIKVTNRNLVPAKNLDFDD